MYELRMKMGNRKNTIMLAVGLILVAGSANAALVDLKWTTTVESVSGVHPGIAGESVVTTIQVDNGGSNTVSQTWTVDDFVKYRIDGASGWWYESNFVEGGSLFTTDDGGLVTNAGGWVDTLGREVDTSYQGKVRGYWHLDGNGSISVGEEYDDASISELFVLNTADNAIGSSWTASTTSVTEPSVFALFGLGLVGIGFARRRRS
jgi:hypothetical protein